MFTVKFEGKEILCEENQLLSELLMKNKVNVEHVCGGMGICRKCTVLVNGKEELSCKYRVNSDITVEIPDYKEFLVRNIMTNFYKIGEDVCLCLDIGTTTLALACVGLDTKAILTVITEENPQRIYGADVISRIDYCNKNSVLELKEVLVCKINEMIKKINCYGKPLLFVTGNTTMLHILFGEECSSLGVYPYTPTFFGAKFVTGENMGIPGVDMVLSLPSIHTFAGSDLVAGMNYTGIPQDGSYYLLLDLGTNAEIALYSNKKILCTSAAAGPCFEGGNISCGMSATNGAIYRFSLTDKGDASYKTIGNEKPRGICGTALIDIVAQLLKYSFIDESGYMPCEKYIISDEVYITQKDVRQLQMAKSAVYSAIMTLLKEAGISIADVSKIFISGGFSSEIDIENALALRILPRQSKEKFHTIKNSALLGVIKSVFEDEDIPYICQMAQYVDLSQNPVFSELFIENMEF